MLLSYYALVWYNIITKQVHRVGSIDAVMTLNVNGGFVIRLAKEYEVLQSHVNDGSSTSGTNGSGSGEVRQRAAASASSSSSAPVTSPTATIVADVGVTRAPFDTSNGNPVDTSKTLDKITLDQS